MREKLIKLLCQAHNKATDASAFDGATYAQQLEAEADHLIANGVTFATDNNVGHKWISVKDRLPVLHIDDYEEPDGSRVQFEVSEDQWVFTASGHKTKARYETGVVFQGWVGDYGETIRDVTHWMPLPPAPEDVK